MLIRGAKGGLTGWVARAPTGEAAAMRRLLTEEELERRASLFKQIDVDGSGYQIIGHL